MDNSNYCTSNKQKKHIQLQLNFAEKILKKN